MTKRDEKEERDNTGGKGDEEREQEYEWKDEKKTDRRGNGSDSVR